MSVINFVGIDASMSNIGLARGKYNLAADQYWVTELALIQTFPSKDKKVRKSSIDYDRCRESHQKLHNWLTQWKPTICFAEMPTGSQSANGMKSYGISLMLLATINTPVVQISPAEVKVAAVGSKNASKETMIKWAHRKWPDLPWIMRLSNGASVLQNKNEHLADACGAIEAGLASDQWLQLRSMLKHKPSDMAL